MKNKPDGLFFTRLFVPERHKQLWMASPNADAPEWRNDRYGRKNNAAER